MGYDGNSIISAEEGTTTKEYCDETDDFGKFSVMMVILVLESEGGPGFETKINVLMLKTLQVK